MRIISIPISPGDNNLLLVADPIEKIEFETNAKKYSLKFTKTNNFDNKQEVKLYIQGEPFNSIWFSLLSDGLTNLTISSTCAGVFTLYYSSFQVQDPVLKEIATIKKDFEIDYYFTKYFTLIENGGYLLEYDRLKNFKYYRDCITKTIASWATTCYQNVKTMSIPQALEYIYSVEITSEKDTFGTLSLYKDIIYNLDIKCGTHLYPLVILRRLAVYSQLILLFNDPVTIKYNFFNLPCDLTKFLHTQKVYVEQYPVLIKDGLMLQT